MSKYCLPFIAVLTLAACDSSEGVRISRKVEIEKDETSSRGLKVISTLQCPADQGVLTRQGSASVDGKTCTYTGPRGAEIKLHLVSLDGTTADAVLKSFQTQLSPEIDLADEQPGASFFAADPDQKSFENGRRESASVHLPGMKVDAEGERASVRLPGMSIEADGDRANIRIGGMVIRADDKGSTITDDQGIKIVANEKGTVSVNSMNRTAIRATLLHKMSNPSANGWRVVGYEARGPGGGPIAVATFRTRDRDEDAIVDAVRELVILNVGD